MLLCVVECGDDDDCRTEHPEETGPVLINITRKKEEDSEKRNTEKGKNKLYCDICDKKYKHKVDLINHKKGHLEENVKYPCKICNSTFAVKQSLQYHERSVHLRNLERVQCEICQKEFTHDYYVKKHISRVHKIS